MIRWICTRVALIYIVLLIFSLTCIDLKMLDMRIKTRHLNSAIPDFSDMIIFSKDQNAKKDINWKPYKNYFELILRYMPEDVITEQLLGYVDFNMAQEQKAMDLFKSSAVTHGQALFWPNYNLGVLYYKKGMWPQAAEYLLKAFTSNTKVTLILMQDSMVYKQIFISSSVKYSLSDEINDAQGHAYVLLLSCLQNMKQYDKMLIMSNLGIANQNLSYKDAFYYYAGIAYFEAGQMDKAFMLFQKSLSIEKNNPDVYYYMANIYQKVGQLQQARDFLQLSYALHQKNDPRFPYESQVNLRFF